MDTEKSLSIVLVEWDGGVPPTKWYNRLKSFGLFVSGNKDQSPLDRRLSHKGEGVIFQEGAILVPQEGTAKVLACLATECGARAVSIGHITLTDDIGLTANDKAALDRVQAVLGKRGRPVPSADWAVVCYDCLETNSVNGRQPVSCPHCSSFHIKIRQGFPVITYDTNDDVYTAWQKQRFLTGSYERPILDINSAEKMTPEFQVLTEFKTISTLDTLANCEIISKIIQAVLRNDLPRWVALSWLDAAYCTLFDTPSSERQNNRIQAIAKYFEKGGTDYTKSLNAKQGEVDFLDIWNKVPSTISPIDFLLIWENDTRYGYLTE